MSFHNLPPSFLLFFFTFCEIGILQNPFLESFTLSKKYFYFFIIPFDHFSLSFISSLLCPSYITFNLPFHSLLLFQMPLNPHMLIPRNIHSLPINYFPYPFTLLSPSLFVTELYYTADISSTF